MTDHALALARSQGGPDIALADRLFGELRDRTSADRGITRVSYGPGEQIAHDIVTREARRLELEVTRDAARNLYMTLPGHDRSHMVIIGSHLDSVPRGGNYDGAAGVLMGMSVVAGYRRAGLVPPQDITVMAVRAEESTWFNASYIGSRAALGLLSPTELDTVARQGDRVTLGTAIHAAGGDVDALAKGAAHLTPARVRAYIEPHIEQGPLLLSRGVPLGIVTGIRGSFRHRSATCTGVYAHSGATPRENRQDAALAVSRLVVAMDDAWTRLSEAGHDLTVTFGQVFTDPDEAAFSKVAGRMSFALDVRSESVAALDLAKAELHTAVARIEQHCGVRFDLGPLTGSTPALMAPGLVRALEETGRAEGFDTLTMPCGAGHDAAVFANQGIASAMILLRNAHGSHNPDEHMEMDDFAAGARLLSRLCIENTDWTE